MAPASTVLPTRQERVEDWCDPGAPRAESQLLTLSVENALLLRCRGQRDWHRAAPEISHRCQPKETAPSAGTNKAFDLCRRSTRCHPLATLRLREFVTR